MLPISGLCGEHAARSRKRQPGRRCLLITPLAELVSCNYILADAPQHLYFIKPPHGWKIATTLQSLRFHERLCARKRCDRSGRSGHRLQWLRLLTLCSCAAVAPSNDLHSAIATGPPNDRPATWNRHASSQLPIAKTFVCGSHILVGTGWPSRSHHMWVRCGILSKQKQTRKVAIERRHVLDSLCRADGKGV